MIQQIIIHFLYLPAGQLVKLYVAEARDNVLGRYHSAEQNNFSRVRDVVFSFSSNQSFRFAECEEIFPLIRIRDNFRLFYNQIEKILCKLFRLSLHLLAHKNSKTQACNFA